VGRGTNGVLVRYGNAVVTADRITIDRKSEEVIGDGKVRIQEEGQLWVGELIRYNFRTRQMETEQFRTGRAPVFAAGHGLHSEETSLTRAHVTNRLYAATNAFVTTDDVAQPGVKVRARYIKIIPGDKIVAYDAILSVLHPQPRGAGQ
jgi:lipopolysaccharide assembly outer membrane protein LptD (OstA)